MSMPTCTCLVKQGKCMSAFIFPEKLARFWAEIHVHVISPNSWPVLIRISQSSGAVSETFFRPASKNSGIVL